MRPLTHLARLGCAATGLTLVATAAPALALTVVNGQVTGDATDENIVVSCTATKLAANGIATGSPCVDLERIFVSPQDGMDTVNMSAVTTGAFPKLRSVEVDLDDGFADTFIGSGVADVVTASFTDTVQGGAGNDQLTGGRNIIGGDGDDVIIEAGGILDGGAGDDRFLTTLPAVQADGGSLNGGVGTDSMEIDFDSLVPNSPNIRLELVATASQLIARLVPTDGTPPDPDQVFAISSIEHWNLTLLREDTQVWDGSAFPGTQHIRGMGGPDTISGGASDDALFGGGDNDTLTGGGGADVLQGGLGNDVIQARDGVVDRVDCGEGTDSVVGDHNDVLVGCETADLTAAPVTPPPPPPPALPAAPETSAISGPSKVKKPKKVSFKYSSTTAGATFECRLDSAGWKPCGSSYKVNSKRLKRGKHKLWVRAVSGDRHDTSPSLKKFKVV